MMVISRGDKVNYKFGLDADYRNNPGDMQEYIISPTKKIDNEIRER